MTERGGDDLFFAAAAEAAVHNGTIVPLDEKKLDDDSIDVPTVDHPVEDGYIVPTDEEMETLRHVADYINWSTYMVAFVEFAERFSYYGSTQVFTNFIQQPLPAGSSTGAGGRDGQSGALGQGQQAAVGLTTFNTFWVYVTPLLGAYMADTYWGRYKTIMVAIAIATVGHILLIISAIPPVIVHGNRALACFAIAILSMGLGTGAFKSNISPLIAEQQRHLKPFIRVQRNGERVIVDPAMTTARIYMWFYFFINVGALVGPIGMTYGEKYIGFWFSFMLPTVVFLFAPIVLALGRKRYHHSKPEGSVLVQALRVWRYAARGRLSWNPLQTCRNLSADDFYESAKPSKIAPENRPSWMTFDDKWVDEVRRGFKACEVFVWFPIYWLPYNQITNNLTSQAAVMQTHGVPNDIINNLDPFAILILIPIHDLFVYPALRRLGVRVTPLRKITAGFFTGTLAMIWAAVVQHYIYQRSPCGYYAANSGCDPAPLNVWIQSGSYVLIAISEIYASITGLEYAFTKAPQNMKSLVMSVFLFTSAVAAAIGEAFVTLSTDPLLVWNYGAMAVISFIGGILFWIMFRKLDAQEEELNAIGVGEFQVGRKEVSEKA
ncbi:PTR2-domain-containing protein [Vararia minispora EC-137]|uniref:PTR2-domain-containing protein n=1 Tax=Vararia minispora EC-137 TaxID=1314806 RepID=A0ACB8QDR4_9AGAM|nr:PTR2-domain-containing protein [Vararia minispora EC-137]